MKTKNVSFLGFVFAVVGAVLAASGCDNDSTSAKTVIEGGILYREVERTVPTLEIVEKSADRVYYGYKFDVNEDPDTQPSTSGSWSTWETTTDGNNAVYKVQSLNKSAVTKFPYTVAFTFEKRYRLAQGFDEEGAPVNDSVTLDKAQVSLKIEESDFAAATVGKTPIAGGWLVRRTVPTLVIIPGSVTDTSVLVGYEVPANEDPETAITESGSSSGLTTYTDKGNLADDSDDRTYKAKPVSYPGTGASDVKVTFVSDYETNASGSTVSTATRTVSLAVAAGDFAAKASAIPAVTAANVKVYSGKAGDTNGTYLSSLTDANDRSIRVALPLNYSDVDYVKYRYKYQGDNDWAYFNSSDRFAYEPGNADSNRLNLKTAVFNANTYRYKVAATSTIKTNYGSLAFPGAPTGSTLTSYQVSGVGNTPSFVSTYVSYDGYVAGSNAASKPVWQIGSTYSTTADGTITTFVGIDGTTYRNTTGGTNAASTGVTTTSGYISYGVAKSVSAPVNGITRSVTVYVPVTVTQSQDIPTTVELKFATANDGFTESASGGVTANGYSGVTLTGYTAPTSGTPGFSVTR
ncbi:MAG: hypothetical protein MdMp014T_1130 [Treponematales bacterium]